MPQTQKPYLRVVRSGAGREYFYNSQTGEAYGSKQAVAEARFAGWVDGGDLTARYEHIARLLRAEMTKRRWRVADLNEAIGIKRRSTKSLDWLAGRTAPHPKAARKLAQALGQPIEAFMTRDPVDAPEAPAVTTLIPALPVTLTVRINADGSARLTLDVPLTPEIG